MSEKQYIQHCYSCLVCGENHQWTIWVVELGPRTEVRTEGVDMMVTLPSGQSFEEGEIPKRSYKKGQE